MSDIAAADGTFFTRFGQRIQSADHIQVADAVREAGRRILDVVDPVDPGQAVSVYVARNAVVNVNVAVSEQVAAVFYGAVEIALYIGIILLIAIVIPLIDRDGGSNIEFESAVQTLTTRFDPNSVPSIPTLSQWGTLVLLLAFLILGTVFIYRRHVASASPES
jgi:hypothetical protein